MFGGERSFVDAGSIEYSPVTHPLPVPDPEHHVLIEQLQNGDERAAAEARREEELV